MTETTQDSTAAELRLVFPPVYPRGNLFYFGIGLATLGLSICVFAGGVYDLAIGLPVSGGFLVPVIVGIVMLVLADGVLAETRVHATTRRVVLTTEGVTGHLVPTLGTTDSHGMTTYRSPILRRTKARFPSGVVPWADLSVTVRCVAGSEGAKLEVTILGQSARIRGTFPFEGPHPLSRGSPSAIPVASDSFLRLAPVILERGGSVAIDIWGLDEAARNALAPFGSPDGALLRLRRSIDVSEVRSVIASVSASSSPPLAWVRARRRHTAIK